MAGDQTSSAELGRSLTSCASPNGPNAMDKRHEILSRYENLALHEANEAETRLKVIDQILFDLLSWTHDDVTVEERVSQDNSTTYADYVFRTGMTAFVVEAKKMGITFSDVPNKRRASLRGKILSGVTGEAIKQARQYAAHLGIPFSIVTNGAQWIIFPAQRTDQVPINESSAIIFPSLRSVLLDDFFEFEALLSRSSIIQGSLEQELLGRIEDQLEHRRLNTFFTTGFSYKKRNSIYPFIEDAIVTAFTEDIIRSNTDILQKCYVNTADRIKFDKKIRMHIQKREAVAPTTPARPLKGKRPQALDAIIAEAQKRSRPVAVLILGTVGAGKTTFIHYTRNISARELFKPTPDRPFPHWLYIDMRGLPPSQNPSSFIYASLRELMAADDFLSSYERCIGPAYKQDMKALFSGPLYLLADDESERKKRASDLIFSDYQNVSPYVTKILSYCAKNASVFIIIDNIDQFEHEKVQANIFSDAIAIGQSMGANIILAMRDSTYVKQKHSPIFDAFDFDPIYIDPPHIMSVLSRRFFLSKNLVAGRQADFVAENGANVHVSDLSVFVDIVQESVLGTEVGELIDVMATADVRLALRMTREFLQYGYTAPEKALRERQAGRPYILPKHEALRAIMLGNQEVYADEYSVVGNPFDAKLSNSNSQLLRLFILSALVNYSSDCSFQYVTGGDIQNAIRNIGFSDDVCVSILRDLCTHRFAYTAAHGEATLEANFMPSRLGGYVVRELIGNFAFIENVLVDTFISDTGIWHELKRLTHDIYGERNILRRLEIRCERAKLFFDYMKHSYIRLREESVRRGLPREWCCNPLEDIETTFDKNIERAKDSARRNYK